MKRRGFLPLLSTFFLPVAGAHAWGDKIYRIGVLTFGSRSNAPTWTTFVQALGDLGYVEGRSLLFESRSAEGQFERLPGIAAELASMNVDVIVVFGPGPIQAAKAATSKIPIVMIA